MKHLIVACCLNLLCLGASQAADLMIVATEKPVRLIRGVQTFKAGPGVVLQKGDILESGMQTVQIEMAPAMVMSVAPHARLYLADVGSKLELAVLDGWLKVRSKGTPLVLQSGWLRSRSDSGSLVFHTEAGKSELFPEEGEVMATASGAGSANATAQKITQEQYVLHLASQPLKIMPRPAKEFLAAIPKPFRDALTSQAAKLNGKTVAPDPEYDIQYADVEAWLKTDLPVKKEFVKRFKPMLKNPDFRRSLEAELGQMPEWKLVLHPLQKKPSAPSGTSLY